MTIYIDTCIWIDYLEERTDTNIFVDVINSDEHVIVSDLLLKELTKHSSYEQLIMIIKILSTHNLLIKVKTEDSQENEALRISTERKIPFGDALHAIIARDTDAELVTRDKHFLKLKDICKVKLL